MEKIKYKNIKFKKLNQLTKTDVSTIYIDKGHLSAYKIFKNTDKSELRRKEEKLKMFKEISSNNIVVPHTLIERKNLLCGDISLYIKDSIALGDITCYYSPNITKEVLIEVSKSLEKIHNNPNNIIVGDLHFYNIILDKYLKNYFIDVDSYGINGVKPDNNSILIDSYMKEKKLEMKYTQNLDRLSFMLSLFRMLTGKNIIKLNETIYDLYTQKYEFLNDLKEIYLKLKNADNKVEEVPYLYELIK